MNVAECLLAEVKEKRPDLYRAILNKIPEHRLPSMLKLFQEHLRKVDLDVFNKNREAIPEFVWAFVKRFRLPTPGDPFGIQLTCRITKSNTQGTLDSKHLKRCQDEQEGCFNVEKPILDELALFSTQTQVFELANRRKYATVFLAAHADLDVLQNTLPEAGLLLQGDPFNKGRDVHKRLKYLNAFSFILLQDRGFPKILYRSSRDLCRLLRHLPIDLVLGFSDVRYLFQKCGIVSHFFNMMQVVEIQMLNGTEKDLLTIVKYQCRSGTPLPLTRDGLAKNPDRSPLEVLSFEAPKKNFARLSTGPQRGVWFGVETSADKIFFGQQFNEGTGYSFALLPKAV